MVGLPFSGETDFEIVVLLRSTLVPEERGGADLMLLLYLFNFSSLSHHYLVPSHSLCSSVLGGAGWADDPLSVQTSVNKLTRDALKESSAS
jgi:hypothetical protein